MPQRTVALAILGSTLDAGYGPDRWERWRPTVDLCRHEHFLVDRFELLVPPSAERLSKQLIKDIRSVSPETAICAHPFDIKDAWDFEEVYTTLLDLIQSLKFDPLQENYLVHISTGTHVMQICWYLMTEAQLVPGKLLQSSPSPQKGAPGSFRIIDLDLSRYDTIRSRFAAQKREDLSFLKSGIETKNPAFNALIDEIEVVATRSRAPLLLMGPTGAGKTKLARQIFALLSLRNRVSGSFVEVNCATLRGDQAMSTLFGHKRGAFTSAVKDRVGLLAQADKGVLFLDEIGELGLDEQAMLLRAIEDRRFTPLGAESEVSSDFQLIAGTHKNLLSAVRKGEFRADLMARIDLWSFTLPGLAQRPEDIAPNLDFELDRLAEQQGWRPSLTPIARTQFLNFATSPRATWPGNFRDFSGAIIRMATLAPKGQISPQLVNQEIDRLQARWHSDKETQSALVGALLGPAAQDLDLFDIVQLEEVLRICLQCCSLAEAGRRLFAQSRLRRRSTNDGDRLRKYLAKFDLDFDGLHAALEGVPLANDRAARS